MPSPCRFPPPWSIEEQEACFTVENGQVLAYVYFEEEPKLVDNATLDELLLSIKSEFTTLGADWSGLGDVAAGSTEDDVTH